jgi:hypothetical protein
MVVLADEPGAADVTVDGDGLVAVAAGEAVIDDVLAAAEADGFGGGDVDQRGNDLGMGALWHSIRTQ